MDHWVKKRNLFRLCLEKVTNLLQSVISSVSESRQRSSATVCMYIGTGYFKYTCFGDLLSLALFNFERNEWNVEWIYVDMKNKKRPLIYINACISRFIINWYWNFFKRNQNHQNVRFQIAQLAYSYSLIHSHIGPERARKSRENKR